MCLLVHSHKHTHAGEVAFMIHCCRWVLIWMCGGVQPNKIWQEIRRQRSAREGAFIWPLGSSVELRQNLSFVLTRSRNVLECCWDSKGDIFAICNQIMATFSLTYCFSSLHWLNIQRAAPFSATPRPPCFPISPHNTWALISSPRTDSFQPFSAPSPPF